MLHNEKGTFMVPFLLWHKSDITPDLLRAVHELPGSPGARRARAVVEHTRKPGLRGRSLRRSPLGSRAPRGEDTSEPVPRPSRGRVGSSGQGFEFPMLHLIPETESESNLVRFLLFIDLGQVLTLWNLIFYTKIRPHSINTLNR